MAEHPPTPPDPGFLLVWMAAIEGRTPAEIEALAGVVEATCAAMDVAAEQWAARQATAPVGGR